MVSIVSTVAYLGLEARSVEVQCQVAPGMVGFAVVGLPDKAVAESRERVRAAISALGLALPPKRITINLSPADLPKEGSHYDLPIALALLGAMGLVDAETLAQYVVVGELGLDGRVAGSPGVLLAALHASSRGMGLICPAVQGSEAAWAGEIEVIAAPDLLGLLNHLKGQSLLRSPEPGIAEPRKAGPDMKMVKGQETAKRALEIAAAGGHNLFMVGPPGAGIWAMLLWHVAAHRVAPRIIRQRYRDRCWIALTYMWRCRRSAPRTLSCRRPAKGRRRLRCALMPRAMCKARVWQGLACAPMRIWTVMRWRPLPAPTPRARNCWHKRRRPCGYPRAVIRASCGSREQLPILPERATLAASISQRP